MKDLRIDKLAKILVNFSVKVQKGDRVLIQNNNLQKDFIKALVRAVYEAGGLPFVSIKDVSVERELLLGATKEQMQLRGEIELEEMKRMNCFIGFRAMQNLYAQCDVPSEKMELYEKYYYKSVHMEQRLSHTRWVVLRWPTPAMAQLSEMSEEQFEDFYFKVCCLDYEKMSKAMDPLVELMQKTDRVRIVSPASNGIEKTDITFSIKGMPAIKCDGKANIPDGEVYTAPVKDSVNGTICYNTPSLQGGFLYQNISFDFKNGKIVNARANDVERINKVLDTDAGSRFVGEFAIGVNPHILKPMKETLFDEKIAGSIHFTPGNAYDDCDNGNKSAVHWDLVLIQRAEYGGGEIYFDDKLIRKNGIFVPESLQCLNPENLV